MKRIHSRPVYIVFKLCTLHLPAFGRDDEEGIPLANVLVHGLTEDSRVV